MNIHKKHTIRIYLLVAVLALGVYANSIGNEYSMDDEFVTADNPLILKGIKALPEIFTTYYFKKGNEQFDYRPMVKASFAIEYSLFGRNPHMSHFINVLLYSLACCLLLKTLLMLFGESCLLFSLLTVLLFAVHPIHTEVVCSLKNRDVLLTFIASMSALVFCAKYCIRGQWKYLIYGALFFFIAELCKSDSLAYFFIIPFTLFYFKKCTSKQLAVIVGVLFFAASLMQLLHYYVIEPGSSHCLLYYENPLFENNSFARRLPVGFSTLLAYLRLLILPYPLICYYGFNQTPVLGWDSLQVIAGLILTLALMTYTLLNFKKRALHLFGLLFFVLSLFVFLNILTPVTGILGERHAFAASLGFCVIVVALLLGIFRLNLSHPVDSGNLFYPLRTNSKFSYSFAVLLLLYSGLTLIRNPEWKDRFSLFSHDIRYAPQSVQLQNLFAGACQLKYYDPKTSDAEKSLAIRTALSHYMESLKIYPLQAPANNNIGIILAGTYQQFDQALPYLEKAVELRGALPEYNYNLGLNYANLNRSQDAIKSLKKCMELDSGYQNAYSLLANIYSNMGLTAEAQNLDRIKKRRFPNS